MQSYKFLKPNSKILHRFTFNSANLVSPALGILNSDTWCNPKELLTLNVTLKVFLWFTRIRETSHKYKKQ